jgi:ribosome biogenesis GTPase
LSDRAADLLSLTGVVMRGTGGVWVVRDSAGAVVEASLRGRLKAADSEKLAVGDEVELERDAPAAAWAIRAIHPRRSRLARRAPGGAWGERTVVANIDQVIVVFAAASPEPHPRMLDRFLVVAAANDVPARIVINKVDLVSPEHAGDAVLAVRPANYPIHFTSLRDNQSLDELREVLTGRISALAGPSGVGKSSLINAVYPGLSLRVGEISQSVGKGRHTTVGSELHPIPGGGYVADTPGLREVGIWGLDPSALDECFLEFRQYLGDCRFADCTHRSEPDCAVSLAATRGAISPARLESYRILYEELSG